LHESWKKLACHAGGQREKRERIGALYFPHGIENGSRKTEDWAQGYIKSRTPKIRELTTKTITIISRAKGPLARFNGKDRDLGRGTCKTDGQRETRKLALHNINRLINKQDIY